MKLSTLGSKRNAANNHSAIREIVARSFDAVYFYALGRTGPVSLCAMLLGLGLIFSASQSWSQPSATPGAAPRANFNASDLRTGFFRLAFGSDLQEFNDQAPRIHKFDRAVAVFVVADSPSSPAVSLYTQALSTFARELPFLQISLIDESKAPDVLVRIVPPERFASVLQSSLGEALAKSFIRLTNPRCTTRLRVREDGVILRADILISDSRDSAEILDCAYHETLHAFGLMNHANDLNWTSLNQNRRSSNLSPYDKALLQILYNPRIEAGMSRAIAEPHVLRAIEGLGLK